MTPQIIPLKGSRVPALAVRIEANALDIQEHFDTDGKMFLTYYVSHSDFSKSGIVRVYLPAGFVGQILTTDAGKITDAEASQLVPAASIVSYSNEFHSLLAANDIYLSNPLGKDEPKPIMQKELRGDNGEIETLYDWSNVHDWIEAQQKVWSRCLILISKE